MGPRGLQELPVTSIVTLYRPVGPEELELIKNSGWKAFPPRLPEQPIFYPVVQKEYAVRIARDWNVAASGAGFVTRFDVDAEYLKQYPLLEGELRGVGLPARRAELRVDDLPGGGLVELDVVARFEGARDGGLDLGGWRGGGGGLERGEFGEELLVLLLERLALRGVSFVDRRDLLGGERLPYRGLFARLLCALLGGEALRLFGFGRLADLLDGAWLAPPRWRVSRGELGASRARRGVKRLPSSAPRAGRRAPGRTCGCCRSCAGTRWRAGGRP